MASSLTRPLLKSEITLKDALADEGSILEQLSYPEKRLDFYCYLYDHIDDIQTIVSHHLCIPKSSCHVPLVGEWIPGTFNVCIPIYVDAKKKVMIRFPLPYMIGESTYPGNAEEKVRCEVATYAWIRSRCPSIPIPYLWGFGFPSGPTFTTLRRAPFLSQLSWCMRRLMSWMLGRPAPSAYVIHPHYQKLTSGYLLIEYVERGRILSETWDTGHDDMERRTTLFRHLSRVMLELAQIELPRIGSFTMDNNGVVTLTNRPLGLQLHQLENLGIPTGIPRDKTYLSSGIYLRDLLAYHDNRIRDYPNSIHCESEGQARLSTLAIMRTLLPNFTKQDEPFILMLTDLHASNIFVDDNWNLTSLIDLEWTCSQPIAMLRLPHWLTGRKIDQITGVDLGTFDERYEEFVSVLETEQMAFENHINYAGIIRTGWRSGGFWYYNALETFTGLFNLFIQHIQPLYGDVAEKNTESLEQSAWPYWAPDAGELLEQKAAQRQQYLKEIRAVFEQ